MSTSTRSRNIRLLHRCYCFIIDNMCFLNKRENGLSSAGSEVYRSSADNSVCPIEHTKANRDSTTVCKTSAESLECYSDPRGSEDDHVEGPGLCIRCTDYLCCTLFRRHPRNKVSGSRAFLDKDSMQVKSVITCDPCSSDDALVEAVVFCSNCKRHLCDPCFRSHPNNNDSEHSVSLDKANINKVSNAVEIPRNDVFTYIRDINVKTATDEYECYITGIAVVSETELALIDNNNRSLKLVNTKYNTVKRCVTFKTIPRGMATLPRGQLAVTFGDERQIHVISCTRGTLTGLRTFKVNGECSAVDYCNEKLYVSFWKPVKFQILRPTGAVQKTIEPGAKVLELCTVPRHIAVSPDESSIYISDWKTNNVFCMDMDGNMIARYEYGLDLPYGIIFSPTGSLYLCNREQDVVYNMPADLSEATVILGPGDGLEFPLAICCNAARHHLFISSGCKEVRVRNFVKVYQLKSDESAVCVKALCMS